MSSVVSPHLVKTEIARAAAIFRDFSHPRIVLIGDLCARRKFAKYLTLRGNHTVSHTVLICDDTPYIRALMSNILQRGGFEVIGEAATGTQAVEKYKELRPDVITLDIVMRDMGGLDAMREIRRFDQKARILMCSAMAPPALVSEAIEAGASDFVVKPFQPSRLLEAVQSVLG